jgi:chemotaxis protein MotB
MSSAERMNRGTRGRRRQRRRHGDGGEGHGDGERWLLTYADMITLLMALFMVLFSISSVNVSKFQTLKETLAQAFSPKVLSGGGSILPDGGASKSHHPPSEQPTPAAVPQSLDDRAAQSAHQAEQDEFLRLKRELDAYARRHGFSHSIETLVDARGLVIRLLTDRVLYDSGSAVLKPEATPLLTRISALVDVDTSHPISVEGNTDNVPIATGRFPSNWELSAARAAGVARFMAGHGVLATRLEATGVADQRPIDSNDSALGRERNRRVEIALLRGSAPDGGPSAP